MYTSSWVLGNSSYCLQIIIIRKFKNFKLSGRRTRLKISYDFTSKSLHCEWRIRRLGRLNFVISSKMSWIDFWFRFKSILKIGFAIYIKYYKQSRLETQASLYKSICNFPYNNSIKKTAITFKRLSISINVISKWPIKKCSIFSN